jgi:hypothetical protein
VAVCWLLILASVFLVPTRTFADDTVVIVVGAPGTPEYGGQFATWADRWAAAAGQGAMHVVQIGRDDSTTLPTTGPTTSPATDKDRLREVLRAESAEPAQPLWLVLIGHGTFDGREAKFNLRGPDFSDAELADWLRPMRRPLAVIDCSSASGPMLRKLAGSNRVIITATRSGEEMQFAHFGQYMASAIADPAADLDKDGQTSLLEAFLAASHGVDDFYKQAGRLSTEHALLDDNGDGLGISADFFRGVRAVAKAARSSAPLDGARAHQWCMVPSAAERAIPPAVRARRDELELAIENLRQKKASIAEAEYYGQLEPLLVQLARLYATVDSGATTAPNAPPLVIPASPSLSPSPSP